MSPISTKMMEALLRLVRFLFGRGRVVNDVELGSSISVGKANVGPPAKTEVVPKAVVPTYKPDLAGVPALVLASMAVSAACTPDVPIGVKKAGFPTAPSIPVIIVTPPPVEEGEVMFSLRDDKIVARDGARIKTEVDMGRAPLRQVANKMARVHGKVLSRKTRGKEEKENIREHPNAPRRPQLYQAPPRLHHIPLVVPGPTDLAVTPQPVVADPVTVAHPASSAWDLEKARRLEEARLFSEKLKARRRRSLPTPTPPPSSLASSPLVRRASAPARLSLQERLQRVCAAAPIVPVAPAVPVAPLWGDEHVSFVVDEDDETEDHKEAELSKPVTPARRENVGSVPALHDSSLPALSPSSTSSSSSITSVLEALEAEFRSPAWSKLQGLADLKAGHRGNGGDSNRDSYCIPGRTPSLAPRTGPPRALPFSSSPPFPPPSLLITVAPANGSSNRTPSLPHSTRARPGPPRATLPQPGMAPLFTDTRPTLQYSPRTGHPRAVRHGYRLRTSPPLQYSRAAWTPARSTVYRHGTSLSDISLPPLYSPRPGPPRATRSPHPGMAPRTDTPHSSILAADWTPARDSVFPNPAWLLFTDTPSSILAAVWTTAGDLNSVLAFRFWFLRLDCRLRKRTTRAGEIKPAQAQAAWWRDEYEEVWLGVALWDYGKLAVEHASFKLLATV
ncbi:hypothetical protein FB451DRAFT_1196073 [Mycena latifolia]|nr:hypothetical protein FB451DRAFT_1196073 [Mycena latifolia]